MSDIPPSDQREFGPQPIEDLLKSWGLSHHELVESSPEQLTHKQVQRAAKGRKLTLKMRQKMTRTLNLAVWGRLTDEEREGFEEYLPKHLFNYDKGYDADFSDPSAELYGVIKDRPLRKDVRTAFFED